MLTAPIFSIHAIDFMAFDRSKIVISDRASIQGVEVGCGVHKDMECGSLKRHNQQNHSSSRDLKDPIFRTKRGGMYRKSWGRTRFQRNIQVNTVK